MLKVQLPSGRIVEIEALLVPRIQYTLLSVSCLSKDPKVNLSFLNNNWYLNGEGIVSREEEGVYHFLGKLAKKDRDPEPSVAFRLAAHVTKHATTSTSKLELWY
jgi:hypothetical protein